MYLEFRDNLISTFNFSNLIRTCLINSRWKKSDEMKMSSVWRRYVINQWGAQKAWLIILIRTLYSMLFMISFWFGADNLCWWSICFVIISEFERQVREVLPWSTGHILTNDRTDRNGFRPDNLKISHRKIVSNVCRFLLIWFVFNWYILNEISMLNDDFC